MTPEYNSMANSLVMWLACAPGVLIVLYQSWLFFRRSIKDAPRVGLTDKQVKAAIRSATVTSVGPCFVMLTAMLSLMLYVVPLSPGCVWTSSDRSPTNCKAQTSPLTAWALN